MPPPNARVAIRAVLAVAGAPVLVRAAAAGAAVGIPAAIVFAPNGLEPRVAVAAIHGSVGLRLVLWVGWLLLAAPATRAAFEAPGTVMLRAFRLRRVHVASALLLVLAAGQVPWALLFGRGGGAFDAIAAAWRLTPEQPSFALRLLRPTRPSLALYGAHLLRLARTARARLVIGAMAVAGGGAALATIGAEHVSPTPRALVALTLPLVLAAALVAPTVFDSERGVRVLLRSLRVRRSVVLGAFFAAVATPTTALASGAVLVARTASDRIPLSLAGPVAALSLVVAALVGTWGRIVGRRSGAFVGGVAVLAACLFVVVARW